MKRVLLLMTLALVLASAGCCWQRPATAPGYGATYAPQYAPAYAPTYAAPQQVCVPQQQVYAPPPCVCN